MLQTLLTYFLSENITAVALYFKSIVAIKYDSTSRLLNKVPEMLEMYYVGWKDDRSVLKDAINSLTCATGL